MSNQSSLKKKVFERRQQHVKKKIGFGTKERPRLAVFCSNKHIYIQVIDDVLSSTLVSFSSLTLKNTGTDVDIVEYVAKGIAEKCKEKSITQVVFDRRGYSYQGRIKKLADLARSQGLIF